jgi:hypothetical protein
MGMSRMAAPSARPDKKVRRFRAGRAAREPSCFLPPAINIISLRCIQFVRKTVQDIFRVAVMSAVMTIPCHSSAFHRMKSLWP